MVQLAIRDDVSEESDLELVTGLGSVSGFNDPSGGAASSEDKTESKETGSVNTV